MAKVQSKIKPDLDLAEPSMYRIVYLNDETTTMEFVIASLVKYFNYTPDTALNITTDIHEHGSAVVAVLPYEIAEQKGIEVVLDARANGFPLQVKIEPESN